MHIRLYHTSSAGIVLGVHTQAGVPLLGDWFSCCESEHVLMTDKQAATHANQAVLPELNPYICLCDFTSALFTAPITTSLLRALVRAYLCALKYYEHICSDALL